MGVPVFMQTQVGFSPSVGLVFHDGGRFISQPKGVNRMGQQYSYVPGGQPFFVPAPLPYQSFPPPVYSYGIPAMATAATVPVRKSSAVPSPVGTTPPGSVSPQQAQPGAPGAKPAGDSLDILPTPKQAAMGAALGIPLALGLPALMGDPKEKLGKILNGVQVLEKTPGIGWINQKIEQNILDPLSRENPSASGWNKAARETLQEFMMPLARKDANAAVQFMEQRRLHSTLGQFYARVGNEKALHEAYQNALKQLPQSHRINFLDPAKRAVVAEQGFKPVLESLAVQREHLKKLNSANPEQKKLLRYIGNLDERVKGLDSFYGGMYRSQAELTGRLAQEGVGPVGRTVAGVLHYFQRIFSGETMNPRGQELTKVTERSLLGRARQFGSNAMGHISPLLIPVLMGAFTFGQAFQSADKAKPGEKRSAFFHNLFGAGIANFLGWEVGRKMLNSFGFAEHVFGKFSASRLVLGLTLGGVATELVACLGTGLLFQKGGEALAHAIFGTPSKESLEGKKSQNNPNAALNGTPGAPPSLAGQGVPLSNGRPAALPQQPQFSLSPDEIRRSTVPQSNPNAARFGTTNDDSFDINGLLNGNLTNW